MVIVYVHGFASAFDESSDKVATLIDAGYTVKGLNYKGSDPVSDFAGLKEQLECVIAEHITDDVAVMGTSLGGYYARLLGAIFGLKTILVNPCLHPERTMMARVGHDIENYATKEMISLTEATIEGYHALNMKYSSIHSEKLVLLDEADEVLSSVETEKELREEAHIVMFEGGNHRFAHMPEALPHIEQYLNNYSD